MAAANNPPGQPLEMNDAGDNSRRPVYKTESTGNFWQDTWIAFQRISLVDDLQHLGEIPCARSSLLSGIASGAGVGFIRAMSTSPFVASNWAVGTFMVISLGSWTICRQNLQDERRKMARVIEEMPKRFVKKNEETNAGSERS